MMGIDLKSVFGGQMMHANYSETVGLAKRMAVHAYGEYPGALIDKRRPSESEETKSYRKDIYVPVTQKVVNKVITSIGKIRRSSDWSIQYKQDVIPSVVADGETLEAYCERRYPGYTSVTNWIFSELVKRYLVDANSLLAVVPKALPKDASEYIKPVIRMFDSSQVYYYEPDACAVLLSSETVEMRVGQASMRGKVFYVIDTKEIVRYEQTSGMDYVVGWSYEHGFGELPVYKVKGLFRSEKNNDIIYDSRISPMIPSLDEAVREYSDLQAEIVQHIHTEKYLYVNKECEHCRGSGVLQGGKEKVKEKCPKCDGVGSLRSVSPYGLYLITPSKPGEGSMPVPPAGNIEKQTDIAVLQDQRVKGHFYDALSAVNMEFLADTPLNQSGTAKEVDRDELNIFINSIAEDIVAIMDRAYYFINEYRYSKVVPDLDVRRGMLPDIQVPERYNIMSESMIIAEITAARGAGVNPEIIRALEVDYAKKKFFTNPEKSYLLDAIYKLDPLPGVSEDDKMTRLANGGVTEVAYIISCNIVSFVQRAVFEDADFYRLPLDVQKGKMVEYAEAVRKDAGGRGDLADMGDDGGNGDNGDNG